MATTEKTQRPTNENPWANNPFTNNPFTNIEGLTQTWREMMGMQVRTAMTMADQGMAFSRKAAEHMGTQMQEAAKMQQDAIKYTLTLMDDCKRVMFETAEKAMKNTP